MAAAGYGARIHKGFRRTKKQWVRSWPRVRERVRYRAGLWRWTVWRTRREAYVPGRPLFSDHDGSAGSPWIFHDEQWMRVRHRREHRRLVAQGISPGVRDERQSFTDEVRREAGGGWAFRGRARTTDEWLYLYLDPAEYSWRDYRWSFRFRCHTAFHELQFGLRYRDFYNRYRIRFEAGRVFFDKVYRGRFYNEFASAPFTVQLGRWYDIEIDCWRNRFLCRVDGAHVLEAWDIRKSFGAGSIAIILWEDDGKTDISADITDLRVCELVKEARNRFAG